MKRLHRECRIFTHYLLDREPDEAVLAAYCEAHASPGFRRVEPAAFDRMVLAIARIDPFFTKLADAYSRFFHPKGQLRRKLVLLLAILESRAPYHLQIDTPDEGLTLFAFMNNVLYGLLFALALLAAIPLFGPLQLIAAGLKKPSPAATEMLPHPAEQAPGNGKPPGIKQRSRS